MPQLTNSLGSAGRWAQRALPGSTLIRIAVAVYIGINVGLILYEKRLGPHNDDWRLWVALANAFPTGAIYQLGTEVPYVWSPLAAPVMVAAVHIGYWAWVGVHIAAVALLRDVRLIALVLVSWAFWSDVVGGNTFTFVFVAAALALRGSRMAGVIYIALFLLMPRVVQVPVAAWILWRMPQTRAPAALLFVVHASVVLVSGLAPEWIGALSAHALPRQNLGPSYFIGLWWLVVAIPLGVWCWWRGWLGTAGVVLNTYLLPQYLLMPLLDLPLWRRAANRTEIADGQRAEVLGDLSQRTGGTGVSARSDGL
jgi:hypothetical protein